MHIQNCNLTRARQLLDAEGIERDLRTELPTWIFSGYSPGRNVARELFGGNPIEQSPEEMRLLFYEGLAAGNTQAAVRSRRHLPM